MDASERATVLDSSVILDVLTLHSLHRIELAANYPRLLAVAFLALDHLRRGAVVTAATELELHSGAVSLSDWHHMRGLWKTTEAVTDQDWETGHKLIEEQGNRAGGKRQPGVIDLLNAAVTARIGGCLVTSDTKCGRLQAALHEYGADVEVWEREGLAAADAERVRKRRARRGKSVTPPAGA